MMRELQADQVDAIRESSELCREATAATLGIELDYDESSILRIDEIVSEAWPNGPTGDAAKTYQIWGSFLGEALCHVLGGKWVDTEAGYGVAVGEIVAHPFNKIEKRFTTGMEEAVGFFFKALKQSRSTEGTGSQKERWWPFRRK